MTIYSHPVMKSQLWALAALLLLAGRPALADQDHTRAAFRDVIARLVVAANAEPKFAAVTGKQIADDHGDTSYAVTVFVPVFSACEIRNQWHVPTALWCRTVPNPNASAVQRRFDQVAADIRSVLTTRHLVDAYLTTNFDVRPCAGSASFFQSGERCFVAGIASGQVTLAQESDAKGRKFLLMRIGNF